MAKDPKQEQKPVPTPEVPAEPVGPPKSYRMLATLGFVSLILCQVIVLFLILPARSPYGGTEQSIVNPKLPGSVSQKPMVEKSIFEGKSFEVRNLRDDSTEKFTVKIDVAVFTSDGIKFDKQYESRTAQIHDRVTSILTATATRERQEPGLTTIKEKLRRGLNDALGTPWVQEVYCTGVEIDIQ